MTTVSRTIVTLYYADTKGRTLLKTNRAVHAEKACELALRHLRYDHYQAVAAYVYDEDGGALHAVLRRRYGADKIEVMYQRGVED